MYNIVSKGDTFQDPNNELSEECWAFRRDELILLYLRGWPPSTFKSPSLLAWGLTLQNWGMHVGGEF